MLFTSVSFVIFVATVLLMYYIVPKKWQWIMLLCANVCFYLQAGVRGAIFMIAINYFNIFLLTNDRKGF